MSNNQQEKAKPTGPGVWLKGIGKLRDSLLVLGGATYGLGYLVWSIHAKQENLGLLPALEPQYLAAGVIPMLLVLLACFGFGPISELAMTVTTWESHSTRIRRLAWRTSGVACLVGGLGLLGWLWRKQHFLTNLQVFLRFIAGTILLMIGLIAFVHIFRRSKPPSGLWESIVAWFTDVGFAVITWVLMCIFLAFYLAFFAVTYVFLLYPAIPQELGGVRPRCAYIDVAKDQVSEALRREILPSGAVESTNTVVQSVRMKVYFSTADFLLTRTYPEALQANQPKPKLFELRKEVVRAVNWCD